MLNTPPHSRTAFLTMASNTGCTSLGELEMTRRMSLVAACWSCDSARRFSRSRTLESSLFEDFRTTGSLAWTLAFLGLAPRRIAPPRLSQTLRPGRDRRQARRRCPREQVAGWALIAINAQGLGSLGPWSFGDEYARPGCA